MLNKRRRGKISDSPTVKTSDVHESGEQAVKESSSGPFTQVTYVKSLVNNVQCNFVLTNRRLLFLPGNFQNTDSTILVMGKLLGHPDSILLPLSSTSKVEKG